MQIDIAFEFAKVYNIEKADVVMGQKFSLISDSDSGGNWFSDNGKVLSLDVFGKDADVSADSVGTSTILIMDDAFQILKTIIIQVVDSILPEATKLNPSSDAPIAK